MSQTWIILGATSTIARSFARLASDRGDGVLLAGRDMEDMQATASDCAVRGAPLAEVVVFDARDSASFGALLKRVSDINGTLSVAVFVGNYNKTD